ncbi:hypothetical protein [Pseudoduganella violacea]|uniref:Chromosome segregation ATPase n=1 Tax=Pseudoduganella violacea TaxID=1715466 RepID=A0A7W5BBK8_9BURK|nr:hypothetical protein [Pseudoduganella violacea]MBB3120129.1 chromosome segregation ATPase [Pseudoduganella violacea]
MNSNNRDEIEGVRSRLELLIAANHAELSKRIERLEERLASSIAELKAIIAGLDQRVSVLETGFVELKEKFTSLKITVIVTGLSATLTIILGVGAINVSLLSGMIGAFESGRGMGSEGMEIRHQLQALQQQSSRSQQQTEAIQQQTVKLQQQTDAMQLQMREMQEQTRSLQKQTDSLQQQTSGLREEMREVKRLVERRNASDQPPR